MTKHAAIEVEGLGKRYSLGTGRHQHNTLRDLLADGVKRLVGRNGQSQSRKEAFWALKDATFDIRTGENVGIIGLNGAGKSTLLKILSRITEPTDGVARIAGRVGALLEVGTGFQGELSGRENLYFYGAILGMSKTEITRKFSTIVAFAGIGDFIDTPVKRYSSGMYVRLGFAVAAHLEPDILLLDEVLSVGDLPFQRKCMEFARGLQQRDATILFVSHNMFSIKAMCPRAIYLKGGRIEFNGPTEEAIARYEEDCRLSSLSWGELDESEPIILITGVALYDESGQPRRVFDHGERMKIRLWYKAHKHVEGPNVIVGFIRSDGVQACVYSSAADGVLIDRLSGEGMVELLTPPLKLVAALYTIHIFVWEKGFGEVVGAQVGCTFHVRHDLFDMHFGMFREPGQWLWNEGNGCGEGRQDSSVV